MRRRRVLSLTMAIAMTLSLLYPAAAAADYTDTSNHWAESAIDRWSGYGVVKGDQNGDFNPDANMTVAELATVLDNVMGYTDKAPNTFADLGGIEWYADAVLHCAAAGVIKGDGVNVNATAPIDRERATVILARALNIQPVPNARLSGFSDGAAAADWSAGYIQAMADAGIIQGVGNATLALTANINRASVMTIMDKSVSDYITEGGVHAVSGAGITIVKAGTDVTLTGAAKDIILAPGSAGSSVTLDKMTVTGAVTVNAESATLVAKDAKLADVMVSAPGAAVDLQGTSSGKTVVIAEGATGASLTVAKEARVDIAAISAAETTTSISGSVKSVAVTGQAGNAKVNIEKGGKVDTLTADSATQIQNNGTLGTLNSNVSGNILDGNRPSKVETPAGVEPPKDSGGKDVTTGGATGGGGTGGGETVTYTVTYHANYDGGKAPVDADRYKSGATVTVLDDTYTREGYTFQSWNTASGGSGASYAAGDTFTITADVTLYAQWRANAMDDTYTVTFNSNGGSPVAAQTVKFGEKSSKPADPARTGYDFMGWYKEEALETAWNFTDDIVTGNITLYAKWVAQEVPATYTVTFDSQGADTAADPETETVTAPDTTVQSLPTPPIKAGYLFGGWYTEENGGGIAFTAETAVSGDVTVYAKWTISGEARIDDVFYDTLAEAVAAAEDGDTVELRGDVELASSLTVNKAITLTSAGDETFTITPGSSFPANTDDSVSLVNVLAGATIGAVKLDAKGSDAAHRRPLALMNSGSAAITVTIAEGATLTGGYINSGAGVAVITGASNVNLTVSGGLITGNHATTDGAGIFFGQTSGKLTITGGSITENTAAGYAGGVWIASTARCEVSGGSVTGNTAGGEGGDIFLNANGYGAGSLAMTGGEIGMLVLEADQGKLAVLTQTGGTVETLGVKDITSLTAALAATGSVETVKLMGSIKATDAVSVARALTLDLNGKSFTTDFVGAVDKGAIEVSGELTLKDSDSGKNGKLTTDKALCLVRVTGTGKLTVESGSYEQADALGSDCRLIRSEDSAQVSITGGSFKGSASSNAPALNVRGSSILRMSGGSVTAPYCVGTFNDCTVEISGDASLKAAKIAVSGNNTVTWTSGFTLSVSGGTIQSDDTAIYMPSKGGITVSGGEISGKLIGVAVRMGTLEVTGGSISSAAVRNAGGSSTTGATGNLTGVIVIAQPSAPYTGGIEVSVGGGASLENTAQGEGTKDIVVVDAEKKSADNAWQVTAAAGTITLRTSTENWSTLSGTSYPETAE